MAVKWSNAVKNAVLDAWESAMGVSVKLQLWSGAVPTLTTDTPAGSKLAEVTLDADWAAAAATGSKSMQKGGTVVSSGNPYSTTGLAAAATGTTIAFYRIVDSAGTTCHEQGTVGTSGADLIVDNASIAQNQTINITGFSKTSPG